MNVPDRVCAELTLAIHRVVATASEEETPGAESAVNGAFMIGCAAEVTRAAHEGSRSARVAAVIPIRPTLIVHTPMRADAYVSALSADLVRHHHYTDIRKIVVVGKGEAPPPSPQDDRPAIAILMAIAGKPELLRTVSGPAVLARARALSRLSPRLAANPPASIGILGADAAPDVAAARVTLDDLVDRVVQGDAIMLATLPARVPRLRPRVAVIGGDERVKRITWPESLNVRVYTADEVDKLANAASAGAVDHVVVLTKWMGHAAFTQVRALPVTVHAWPRGIPALAERIEALIGLDARAIPTVDDALPIYPGSEASPEVRAHTTWGPLLLDVLDADPASVWTLRDLEELVGVHDMPEDDWARTSLRKELGSLVALGRVLEPTPGAYQAPAPQPAEPAQEPAQEPETATPAPEPQAPAFPRAEEPAMPAAAPVLAAASTPPVAAPAAIVSVSAPDQVAAGAPEFLILLPGGQVARAADLDTALQCVTETPGAALFKRVRTRRIIRCELDE